MRSSNYWPRFPRRQSRGLTWRGQQLSRKTRGRRTRVSCVPDTRKILFQNVTSFGHKARTCLLSEQMDYDIMGVAEHHLDLVSAAEEAGAIASGGVSLNLDTCQPYRPWRNQWGNHGND